jgi:glycosyltransferase involved in cell wall biosynthesis
MTIGRRRRERFDVAFYTPAVGPRVLDKGSSAGGAETQILLLAGALAARGWRVGIVTYAADAPLPKRADGVRIVPHRPFRGRGRLTRRLGYAVEMARMFATLNADVIVQRAAGSTTGIVALAALLTRRRFVHATANVVDFALERIEPDARIVKLHEFGVRRASAIVVQTTEQVRLCRRRFGREPILIRSIAEPAEPQRRAPEAFLWVGRVDDYKRPELFLALARAVPEATFWMVAVPAGAGGADRLSDLREEARDT